MLRTTDSTGKMPTSEELFQRRLKARRNRLVAGLLPSDARTGYSILGCCSRCGELTGADITLASGRGDLLRWFCPCGGESTHVLDDDFPLPPIGSDAAPVDGRHSR